MLGPAAFPGQGVTIDQRDQRTPMSRQWNFDIQRQLSGQWLLDIAYTGKHGNHLVAGGYDLNQLTDAQYQTLGTGRQSTVGNPYVGIVPGSLGASTITLKQALAAFPYYTSVAIRNPHIGESIYHAALLRVENALAAASLSLGRTPGAS